MAIEERMAAPLRSYRFRQWDREDGPSTVLRWSMAHPVAVTVGIGVVLAAVFALVFGVPPVSPFVLIALLCAPILPWLRSQRLLYEQWQRREHPDRADDDPRGPTRPSPPREP